MTKEPQEEIKEGVYYEEPHPNQNCCDKCHDVTFEKTYPAHTAYHACLNRKCECHKPQEETYQTLENKALEEFKESVMAKYYGACFECCDFEEITEKYQDFLKSHLQLAYEAGLKKGNEELVYKLQELQNK